MSNSSLATEKYLAHKDNYTDGRNTKISEITLHHMAGVLTAKECGAIFQKKGRKASSNYGIGKNGEIALYVEEKDTSWCNSNWNSNCRSVTIEISNSKTSGNYPVSAKVLKSTINLVADIVRRNNLGKLVKGKNLTWHRMYANTNCPGEYLLSKMDYIVDEVNKLSGYCEESHKEEKKETKKSFFPSKGYFTLGDTHENIGKIAEFMYRVFPSYTTKKALGNYYGKYIQQSIKEFQERTNLENDGSVGPLTLAKLKEYGFKE